MQTICIYWVYINTMVNCVWWTIKSLNTNYRTPYSYIVYREIGSLNMFVVRTWTLDFFLREWIFWMIDHPVKIYKLWLFSTQMESNWRTGRHDLSYPAKNKNRMMRPLSPASWSLKASISSASNSKSKTYKAQSRCHYNGQS